MCRGQSDTGSKSVSLRPTVILVDPYSTGAMLAPELEQRGSHGWIDIATGWMTINNTPVVMTNIAMENGHS